MIEVFKTNIEDEQVAEELKRVLKKEIPGSSINFDLEDCDNILKIEAPVIDAQDIISFLASLGYSCELLE